MKTDELDRTPRHLRLGGMADSLTVRAQQARAESLGPIDFMGLLLHDEMERRRDHLVERPIKEADFRDRKTLDTFNWNFNRIDRALIFELATGKFIERHEDLLMLGNAGVGKSHIAQALGMAAGDAGFRVLYREAHRLFEDIVLATASGTRSALIAKLSLASLLVIDDLGMRKLPASVADTLMQVMIGGDERASTIITSNRPLEDWPKLSRPRGASTGFLLRLLPPTHLIEIRGKSYRL